MKVFKKLATLSMALLMVFGVSAFAACDKEDTSTNSSTTESTTSVENSTASESTGNSESTSSVENSSTSENEKTYTCYEFVVVTADGTKVGEGYSVQLCIVDENGDLGSCLRPVEVVNGVCVYNISNIAAPGVYEAHVLDEEYNTVELKETVRTAPDAFGEYTLTLAE